MASGRTSAQGHTPSHWSCPPAQTTSKGHEHDGLIHDSNKALKRGASTEHSHAMFLQIKIAKWPAGTIDPYHWSLITGCFLTNSVSRRASEHPCSVLWLWSPLHCGNHLDGGVALWILRRITQLQMRDRLGRAEQEGRVTERALTSREALSHIECETPT